MKGVVPLSRTRDTVGPMARSVDDLIFVDGIITGDTAPLRRPSVKGLRLGVPRRHYYEQLDSDVAPVIDMALSQLIECGAVLVDAELPDVDTCNFEIARPISGYECMRELRLYLAESSSEITLDILVSRLVSPDVRTVVKARLEEVIGEEEYRMALQKRLKFQSTYRQYFIDHNLAAIIFPTTRLPARAIGDDTTVEFMGARAPTSTTYNHNLAPATIVGAPGLSVPVGLTSSGLPVAMELDGPIGEDKALLSIGLAWNDIFPSSTPPLPI